MTIRILDITEARIDLRSKIEIINVENFWLNNFYALLTSVNGGALLFCGGPSRGALPVFSRRVREDENIYYLVFPYLIELPELHCCSTGGCELTPPNKKRVIFNSNRDGYK